MNYSNLCLLYVILVMRITHNNNPAITTLSNVYEWTKNSITYVWNPWHACHNTRDTVRLSFDGTIFLYITEKLSLSPHICIDPTWVISSASSLQLNMPRKKECLICKGKKFLSPFPKEARLNNLWVKYVEFYYPHIKINKTSRLCYLHFRKKDFKNWSEWYARFTNGDEKAM